MGKPTKRPIIFSAITKEEQEEAYQHYKELSLQYSDGTGKPMTAKKISKFTHLEKFKYNILALSSGAVPVRGDQWIWVEYQIPNTPKVSQI
jgi:hypothetical protein